MTQRTDRRKVRVGYNDVPQGDFPFCIIETWPPYVYRGPFRTRERAEEYARLMAQDGGYEVEVEHVWGAIT